MRRDLALDALRVLCCFFVIVIHVSAGFVMDFIDTSSFQFTIGNLFDSFARVAVPLFIMLSGAFLLDSEKNSDNIKFYRRSFNKLFIPTLCWSAFYFLLSIFPSITKLPPELLTTLIKNWFYGYPFYHLWYLYSIVGLYLLTPFLIRIKNGVGDRIFFRLGVATVVINMVLAHLLNVSASYFWSIDFIFYSGYFILGYSLKKYFEKSYNKIPYFKPLRVFLISSLAIFLVTELLTVTDITENKLYFYGYLSPFVVLSAISLYICFLNLDIRENKIIPLSNLTFDIYFVHAFVLMIIRDFYRIEDYNGLICIPLVSIIVFSISYLIAKFILPSINDFIFSKFYIKE